MGQYWYPVNLDKREFLNPHALGAGLKLWEQLANHPGIGTALILLCAAQYEKRGGGDLDIVENWHGPERTIPPHNVSPGPMPSDYEDVARAMIGRWAGDKIAIVGDYATDSDLAPEYHAGSIYELCVGQYEDFDCPTCNLVISSAGNIVKFNGGWCAKCSYCGMVPIYADITPLVAQVIEHELRGKFEGEGWKGWKSL